MVYVNWCVYVCLFVLQKSINQFWTIGKKISAPFVRNKQKKRTQSNWIHQMKTKQEIDRFIERASESRQQSQKKKQIKKNNRKEKSCNKLFYSYQFLSVRGKFVFIVCALFFSSILSLIPKTTTSGIHSDHFWS